MKLPDQQEVGRAVQILCAAAGVDAKSESVREVSVEANGEVTVTRFIPALGAGRGKPIYDPESKDIYTISTTQRVFFDLPEDNPYMPGGNA